MLSGCQGGGGGGGVHRFLVLHKELDADDGELTRTRRCAAGSSKRNSET